MEETQRIRQAGCKYGTDVMSFLFTTLLVSILANRCTACAGGGGGGRGGSGGANHDRSLQNNHLLSPLCLFSFRVLPRRLFKD